MYRLEPKYRNIAANSIVRPIRKPVIEIISLDEILNTKPIEFDATYLVLLIR
jgi:hypothetical protein